MVEKLCSYPILRYFDVTRPALLYTDESYCSIAAVLRQIDVQGHEYACEYFGRALRKYEKNYSVNDIQLLSVVLRVFVYIWRVKNSKLLLIIRYRRA